MFRINPSSVLSRISSVRPSSIPQQHNASPIVQQVRGYAKKKQQERKDQRVRIMHYALGHPLTPRPLKFSTLRYLRHWTIQRAWNLFKARQRRERDLELERMYNKVRDAVVELSKIGDGGRLYRNAIGKQGLAYNWAKGMRIPTDGPGRVPWEENWTGQATK